MQKKMKAISFLDNCKSLIEAYADSYSKNQNIKNESIKKERKNKDYRYMKLRVGKIY